MESFNTLTNMERTASRMRFCSLMAVPLAATLFTAGAAHAAVVGEVITTYDASVGRDAVMSASNGGSFQHLTCGGDLSHGGSPRYFVDAVTAANYLPDGYLASVLVASDEDCAETRIISNSPDMRFSNLPLWSHDGSRVAVYAQSWELINDNLVEKNGIYVADVTRDGEGRPIGISDLHRVIDSPGEILISWSGDDQRIAYVASAPNGSGGLQNDIWVLELASGVSINATNSPEFDEDHPAFSPVDDRIAFIRMVAVRGTYRFDIFTQPASGGTVTRVTTKGTTGAPRNMFPCFSPDGQYLTFSSGTALYPWGGVDIYRMKADASGKATNLTGKRTGSFTVPKWRP
jgi:Tol biopolymer transport system component